LNEVKGRRKVKEEVVEVEGKDARESVFGKKRKKVKKSKVK
jgi:hypothetical protein